MDQSGCAHQQGKAGPKKNELNLLRNWYLLGTGDGAKRLGTGSY